MVLKKTASAAPKFEDLPDESEMDTVAPTAADTAPVSKPAAAAPAAAAALPVVQKPTALAKPASKVNMADYDLLAPLEDRLPPVGFGEGARLVGSNGNVMDGEKRLLGASIDMLLLSWNKRWVISPGVNGEEAKEMARYSLDGITTTQGEDIKEYVAELKENGFPKAALKEYVDLFGLLTRSDKPSEHVDRSVTVSLSPDSVKAFMGLRRDLVVQGITNKLPEGLDSSNGLMITVSTNVKSGGGNSWTQLVCALAK